MFPNQPQDQPGQQPYQPPAQPQPYVPPVSVPPQLQPYQQAPQQPGNPFPPPNVPQQSPLDYLNQIAPQQVQKKPVFKGMRGIIAIGLILVVLVSILAIVVNSLTSGQSAPAQELAARLISTKAIADEAQTDLKSSELRGVNSNLRLFFTNTNRDIAVPLMAVNVDFTEQDKTVTANETARSALTSERLEDARLNAIYDRTYAREMAFELATMMTLIQQVYNQTNSASLKEYLNETFENLKPTQQAFAEYNEGV